MKRVGVQDLLEKAQTRSSELTQKLKHYSNSIGTVTSSSVFVLPNMFICGICVLLLVAVLLYLIKPSIVMTSTINEKTHFKELTLCPYKIGAYSIGAGIVTVLLVSLQLKI
jgi:hypothetical protein